MPGKVYLVGAGPGDPGLMTIRGVTLLATADVVVYDHLANARLLDIAPHDALRICAGKSVGHCTMTQDRIHEVLIEHAKAGRSVVRLKGGDPLVFGRGAEEAQQLYAAGIPFEIVPGVTAGVGVTAYAGIAVTHRSLSSAVAYVTGHSNPEAAEANNQLDWSAIARFPGTLVIYMGMTHLAAICRTLVREGKANDTPAAIIESGTLSAQRTHVATLETLPEIASLACAGPPGLLVVGDVVGLRNQLDWFERLPLFGQRIVVTRPAYELGRASSVLESMGAEVILAPTVEVRPITDPGPLDQAIQNLNAFDWLVFTSSNGVRFFLERLKVLGLDLRALGHLQIATIGPASAATLAEYHIHADLVPESYRSESLASALADRAKGKRIVLARADRGRTVLKDELDHVANVVQVPVYHNADVQAISPAIEARIVDGSVDWITVTSSAIVSRLHELLGENARGRVGRDVRLASLSPVTTQTATAMGWNVAVEATEYTWDGLVQTLVNQIASERGRSSDKG